MENVYVIFDPHHDYAVALMEHMYRQLGLRGVCVFGDRKHAFYNRRAYPTLDTSIVAARLYGRDVRALAGTLRHRFHVVSVIPHAEWTVTQATELLAELGVTWNAPETLRLFRDKHALNAHVRSAMPGLRLTDSRLVRELADLDAAPLPDRFVMKPNGGMGNTDVGFFDAATPREAIGVFMQGRPGITWVVEERIDGPEFAVNGQVDAKGVPHVLSVLRYERGEGNLQHHCAHVHTFDPQFAPLRAYVEQVMQGTGLKRSPFHAEVKIDAKGPCLIEVAARLGGTFIADYTNDVHGGTLDVFRAAAHYYASSADFGPLGTNWAFYDDVSFMILNGIAPKTETITRLSGVRSVEHMREFRRWVNKPRLGQQVQRTVDLWTTPYCLHLMGHDGDTALLAAADQVRSTLRWNQGFHPLRRAGVMLANAAERLTRKAAWAVHSRVKPLAT